MMFIFGEVGLTTKTLKTKTNSAKPGRSRFASPIARLLPLVLAFAVACSSAPADGSSSVELGVTPTPAPTSWWDSLWDPRGLKNQIGPDSADGIRAMAPVDGLPAITVGPQVLQWSNPDPSLVTFQI